MANMRRGGICRMYIDGVLYPISEDVKTFGGKENRETVFDSQGVNGYIGKPTEHSIEGNFITQDDIDFDAISDMTDVEVMLERGNGKVFTVYHAWSTNPDGMSHDEAAAKLAFKFVGKSSSTI